MYMFNVPIPRPGKIGEESTIDSKDCGRVDSTSRPRSQGLGSTNRQGLVSLEICSGMLRSYLTTTLLLYSTTSSVCVVADDLGRSDFRYLLV